MMVEIPTDPGQPSMNLGQAVAVCLYELSTRVLPAETNPPELAPAAPSGHRSEYPA